MRTCRRTDGPEEANSLFRNFPNAPTNHPSEQKLQFIGSTVIKSKPALLRFPVLLYSRISVRSFS
jgi:hypothetical protein